MKKAKVEVEEAQKTLSKATSKLHQIEGRLAASTSNLQTHFKWLDQALEERLESYSNLQHKINDGSDNIIVLELPVPHELRPLDERVTVPLLISALERQGYQDITFEGQMFKCKLHSKYSWGTSAFIFFGYVTLCSSFLLWSFVPSRSLF
jgi:hypothetical protein